MTDSSRVVLVPIDIERDAPNGVRWLKGEAGRDTLQKMGVTDEFNHESSLQAERERLQKMIDNPNELAWMIQLDGIVVGVTEVHLDEFETLKGPNIHIMIGDPSARERGIGTATFEAVLAYLESQKHLSTVYSRHLTSNNGSAALLQKIGFIPLGAVYTDADHLQWQNMIYGSTNG